MCVCTNALHLMFVRERKRAKNGGREEERERLHVCVVLRVCTFGRDRKNEREHGRARACARGRKGVQEHARARKRGKGREREEKGAIEIECTISCNTVNIKPRTHTTHMYTRTRTHTRAHTYDRMYHEAAGECVDRWGFACVCVRACACARVPCRCG